MLSDGQSRGNMTYPNTNSLSSGSNSASDRTSMLAPTPTTSISQPGNNPHRLPQVIDPHQSHMSSPLDFRAVDNSSTQSFQLSDSNGPLFVSQDYDKPSQRNLRSSATSGLEQASRQYGRGFLPVHQQTSTDASTIPSDDYHRLNRTSLNNPPISILRSPAPPYANQVQQCQDNEHELYGAGYPNRHDVPRTTTFSPVDLFQGPVAPPGISYSGVDNIHFLHSQPTYPKPHTPDAYASFPPSTSLSFHPSSGGSALGDMICEPEATNILSPNTHNRSSPSATITTASHLNVDVTDRPITNDSTRIRASSIPMSNGTPIPTVIIPSAPGPPFSSSSQPRNPPSPTHTDPTTQTTYSPPIPPRSRPMYRIRQIQTSAESLSPPTNHRMTPPASGSEPELSTTSSVTSDRARSKAKADLSRSESEPGPRGAALKKKKKAKMHVCLECGKEFPRPSGLDTHMNTHNNNKPYACTHQGCDRRFSVRSNARRHLKTHLTSASHCNPNPLTSPATPPPTGPADGMGKTGLSQPGFTGFETIIIGEEFVPGNGGNGTPAENANGHGLDSRGETSQQGGSVHRLGSASKHQQPAFFKLRWMPPSSTSEKLSATQRVDSIDRVLDEGTRDIQNEEDAEEAGNERGVDEGA